MHETYLDCVDKFVAAFLGGNRLQGFAQRPALGTRGGILLLWDDPVLDVFDITASTYCISGTVHVRATDVCFRVTSVYGPTDHAYKDVVFAALISHKPPNGTAWLALGDFNQIYRARDKNKRIFNRRRTNRVRAALQSCELK